MSRAKLTSFLGKLKKELKKTSKEFRAQDADVAQNTFYYSPKGLREALKQEFDFREIGYLIEDGTELNTWITSQTNSLLSTLRQKYKTSLSDRDTMTMTGNQHFMMVTLQTEINPKSTADVKNPYNNFVSLRKLYKEEMDKFAKALAKKCSDRGEKLLQTIDENKEYKETGKRNFKNNKRVIGTKEVQEGRHLIEGGHDKGFEIFESKVQQSMDSAFNDEYPRRVDRKVLNTDLKKLGIDLSVERNDRTGEYHFRMQSVVDNRAGGTISAERSEKLREQLEAALVKLDGAPNNILKLQGSTSMLEMKMDETAVKLLTPFENIKNVNVKVTKPKLQKKKTRKPVKAKAKPKTKRTPMALASVVIPSIKLSRSKKVKSNGAQLNPLAMLATMNKQLPKIVAANMNDPRLNYQSGRFAESVRVTDITKTPKGFPSIGYTYDKSPYQTFEPGFAQGSVQRDPRRLIDASIRELAIQFAIGRFYTRRL